MRRAVAVGVLVVAIGLVALSRWTAPRPSPGPGAPVAPSAGRGGEAPAPAEPPPPPPPAAAPAPPDIGAPGSAAAGSEAPGSIAAPAPPASDAAEVEAVERSAWPATPDGIQGAVRESMPALKECYEGWLAESPQLGGRVVVAFTLDEEDGTGRIAEIGLEQSDVGHAVFEACVTSVLGELAFDAPDEPVEVRYPLVFSAG